MENAYIQLRNPAQASIAASVLGDRVVGHSILSRLTSLEVLISNVEADFEVHETKHCLSTGIGGTPTLVFFSGS